MNDILKSATKLTLLGLVLVIIITTLSVVFTNLSSEAITASIMSVFTTTVGVVIGYYFRKGQDALVTIRDPKDVNTWTQI